MRILFDNGTPRGLASILVALTVGTCLRQDWNTAGTQLIYGALYAALLALLTRNRFSLDTFLASRLQSR